MCALYHPCTSYTYPPMAFQLVDAVTFGQFADAHPLPPPRPRGPLHENCVKRSTNALSGPNASFRPVCHCAGGGGGQGWIRREGTCEAAPEAVRQAVGRGCQSGWGRLPSVTNAIEAGSCRQGDSGWALAGRPGGGWGGVPPPLPMHHCGVTALAQVCPCPPPCALCFPAPRVGGCWSAHPPVLCPRPAPGPDNVRTLLRALVQPSRVHWEGPQSNNPVRGGHSGSDLTPTPPPPIILQMHTPAHTSQCCSRQTPTWTRSVHLDAPGQWHGQQPRLRDGRPPE